MIVVVIGVAVVRMHEILAEDMVGERVALFLVVIVGHSRRAPRNISVGRRDGGYRMLPMRSQESSKPGVLIPVSPKGGRKGGADQVRGAFVQVVSTGRRNTF